MYRGTPFLAATMVNLDWLLWALKAVGAPKETRRKVYNHVNVTCVSPLPRKKPLATGVCPLPPAARILLHAGGALRGLFVCVCV